MKPLSDKSPLHWFTFIRARPFRGRAARPLALLIALSTAAACASRPYVWAEDVGREASTDQKIRPGDRISVVVGNQPTLSGLFDVQADGQFVHPLAGHIQASGLTTEQIAGSLAARLRAAIVDPQVSVAIATPRPVHVSVIGEVRTPGSFEIASDEGVLAVLARAGGLTEFGKTDRIYVVRHQPSPMRVRFRYADLTAANGSAAGFRLRDGDVIVVE